MRTAFFALALGSPMWPAPSQAPKKVVKREIIISSETFRPSTATVQLGDTVIWRNTDIVRHTTTSRRPAWDSGKLKSAAQFLWIATQRGTFEYYCTTHKGMKGTLTVR